MLLTLNQQMADELQRVVLRAGALRPKGTAGVHTDQHDAVIRVLESYAGVLHARGTVGNRKDSHANALSPLLVDEVSYQKAKAYDD